MTRDARAYFEEHVIPRIAGEFPNVASDMSIMVEGSVGLGTDDDFSDLEASVYLPDELWRTDGWRVQLLLNRCLRESCPWTGNGSVVCVSRISQLLGGHAADLLAGTKEPSWEQMAMPDLFGLQECLILRDADGRLAKLRAATPPERVPDHLWRKWLLLSLKKLLWADLGELEVSVKRERWPEAQVVLGCVLEDLFHVGFMINKRYCPWRKHLRWAFQQLPEPAAELLPHLDVVAGAEGWERRLSSIEAARRAYARHIHENGLLPTVDVLAQDLCEELAWAERLEAWSNPDWRDCIARCERKAREAGEDARDFWVFSLWGNAR